MELTEVVALRAYAKMLNTLSVEPLESILADYFVYESQTVFQALESKQTFLEHIIPKLQTIHRSNATVYAEMGTVTAYGKSRPCKSASQGQALTLANQKGRGRYSSNRMKNINHNPFDDASAGNYHI